MANGKKDYLLSLSIVVGLIIVFSLFFINTNTSGRININTSDIQYIHDAETDLCFAFVAGRITLTPTPNTLGFTQVPCDKVQNKLK